MDSGILARARAWLLARRSANPEWGSSQTPAEAPVGHSAGPSVTLRQHAAAIVLWLLGRFEGFRSRPYLCPARVWTIGLGATTYLDGRAVGPNDPPISRETGERLAERQVATVYMPGAQALVPTADTAELLAAMTDFAFNLGLTRLKASTLRKRALEGDWDAVQVELRKWVRGGGKILPGLVARREEECRLIRASRTDPARTASSPMKRGAQEGTNAPSAASAQITADRARYE